jgi:prepilin-type processing-associated H-X9-DG protein
VYNGNGNAWGYRGWVMCGVNLYDRLSTEPLSQCPGCAGPINCWMYGAGPPTYPIIIGRVGNWGAAGSLHPAGVQVCMADGSVRFVPETTNLMTLGYMTSMADHVSIGNFGSNGQ